MLTDLSSDVSIVKNLLFNQLYDAKLLIIKVRTFPFGLGDPTGFKHLCNLVCT